MYARDWFVNSLVREPEWRQRLLGVGGRLQSLLDRPLDALDVAIQAPALVGRNAERSAVRAAVDNRTDVVVVGVPGVGKSRLVAKSLPVELQAEIAFGFEQSQEPADNLLYLAEPPRMVLPSALSTPNIRSCR